MFTGNVIVVPDVAAITTPGERVEASMSEILTVILSQADLQLVSCFLVKYYLCSSEVPFPSKAQMYCLKVM